MDSVEIFNSLILKNSNEHKIILDYVVKFEQFLRGTDFNALFNFTTYSFNYLQKDLLLHFKDEEDFFFKATLFNCTDENVINATLMLQKEHGYFERDMEALKKVIDTFINKKLNFIAEDQFIKQIRKFIGEFKHHAKIEIELLFPYIENNEAVKEYFYQIFLTGKK